VIVLKNKQWIRMFAGVPQIGAIDENDGNLRIRAMGIEGARYFIGEMIEFCAARLWDSVGQLGR